MLERRVFRWIQLSEDEVKEHKEKKLARKSAGRKCTCRLTGEKKVECHVDTCRELMTKMSKETSFSGNLSARALPRQAPLIVVGQDECVAKQRALTKRAWVGSEGEQALVPKGEGCGAVLSALQPCELGLGAKLAAGQLRVVSAARKGKKHKGEVATTLKRGSPLKQGLTSSPFALELERGASAEGRWARGSAALQLEGCADVV